MTSKLTFRLLLAVLLSAGAQPSGAAVANLIPGAKHLDEGYWGVWK